MTQTEKFIQHTFHANPVDVVLTLESENLLSEPIDEISPLRRPTAHVENNILLPIIWDSRAMPSAQKHEQRAHAPTDFHAQYFFVARKGQSFDGHSMVENVLGDGHIFIGEATRIHDYLVRQNRPEEWIEGILSHPYLIKVKDSEESLRSLLNLASGIRAKDFFSVAITGTSGKTSTTQILGSLLEILTQHAVMRIGTLGIQAGAQHWEGSHPTMPDYPGFVNAIFEATKLGITDVVFEATSHGLQEKRMGKWLVDVGIFTNLSQDHLDYHKTMEAYRDAKSILFERHLKENGVAILNAEDPEWIFFARKVKGPAHTCIGFGGPEKKDAFLALSKEAFAGARYLEIRDRNADRRGVTGTWILHDGDTTCKASFYSRLLGDFQHENLTAAVAAALAMGYSLDEITAQIPNVPSIPGRLELVNTQELDKADTRGLLPTVLVDYAHKPDALEKTLSTLRYLKGPAGRLICVVGCGGDRDKTKRPIMGEIAARLADNVYFTSDNPRTEDPERILDEILAGVPANTHVVRNVDRKSSIEEAIHHAGPEDIVVIAGKGHEDYQIIGTEKIHFSDLELAADALKTIICR